MLFWDNQLQRDSWRAFAANLRSEPLTNAEIDKHIHGRNGQYTLEYLLGHPLSAEKSAALMEQKESIYREMCLGLGADFRLSPGAIPLLETLIQHDIPHTIATASAKNNVEFFIQHLGLARWFQLDQITYDNGNIAGKPAPDLYLQAANNIGIKPGDCVVIEDSFSGIQAAHAAEIGWVIALGPEENHTNLSHLPEVNQVISDLGQLPTKELFTFAKER